MSDEMFFEKSEPVDNRSHDERIADAVKMLKELNEISIRKGEYRDSEIDNYLKHCADQSSAIARNLEHYFGKNWTIFQRFLSFVARDPKIATRVHIEVAVKALEYAASQSPLIQAREKTSLSENIIEDLIEIAETGFFETTGADFVARLTELVDKQFPDDSYRVNEKLLWLLSKIGNASTIPFLNRLPSTHPNWMSKDKIAREIEFFRNKK